LLRACSLYFKAAFEGPWKERQNGEIKLFDVKPVTFILFLDWLYFRRIPEDPFYRGDFTEHCQNCDEPCPRQVEASHELDFQTPTKEEEQLVDKLVDRHVGIVRLYVFADQYDVPMLRQQIVDLLWNAVILEEDIPLYPDTIQAMERLPDTSPLRRLIVDSYKLNWHQKLHIHCAYDRLLCQRLPVQFWPRALAPMALGTLSSQESKAARPRLAPLCAYHEQCSDKTVNKACKRKRKMLKERAEKEHKVRKHLCDHIEDDDD
jgi:hypothetical protein